MTKAHGKEAAEYCCSPIGVSGGDEPTQAQRWEGRPQLDCSDIEGLP